MKDTDFLREVQNDPQNPIPKLVYADWLDEQGDRKGELIRLLVEVHHDREQHPKWPHFLNSVMDLLGWPETEKRIDKLVDQLDERQQRLFACDCAESVLPIYEYGYPGNAMPKTAIGLARKYANGFATRAQIHTVWLDMMTWAAIAPLDPGTLAWEAATSAIADSDADWDPTAARAAKSAAGYAVSAVRWFDSQEAADRFTNQQIMWLVEWKLSFRR